jgi:hypothetical protein
MESHGVTERTVESHVESHGVTESRCVSSTAAMGPLILLLLHMSSKEADRDSCCSWLGTGIPHAKPIALANPSVSLHIGRSVKCTWT